MQAHSNNIHKMKIKQWKNTRGLPNWLSKLKSIFFPLVIATTKNDISATHCSGVILLPLYTAVECCSKSQDVEAYTQRSGMVAGFHSIQAEVTADRLSGHLRDETILLNKKYQMWLLLGWNTITILHPLQRSVDKIWHWLTVPARKFSSTVMTVSNIVLLYSFFFYLLEEKDYIYYITYIIYI